MSLRATRTFAGQALDYLTFPAFLVAGLAGGAALLRWTEIPNLLITPLVVAPAVALVFLLERVRPERPELERDISFPLEVAHFLFNFEFGYGLALLATSLLEDQVRRTLPVIWPSDWPLVAQLLLMLVLYEGLSYWQHRLFHRRERLWAFHALHHTGARLDLFRSARFHFFDFATVAFLAYLPLVLVGAPPDVITLMAITVSYLGLLHHGNLRMRSPAWLDLLICTPAVHRRHHSALHRESDANFGNTLMVFDLLFGTYAKPDPIGPEAFGIEDDPVPRGFWGQFAGPFFPPPNRADEVATQPSPSVGGGRVEGAA